MNTETKAGHDALALSYRDAGERSTPSYDSAKSQLLADLKELVTDAEKLIKEAGECSAEGIATLRARFDSTLGETKAKLDQARTDLGEKTRQATDATQSYVKENPWKTAGISAVAGAVVGFLLARR